MRERLSGQVRTLQDPRSGPPDPHSLHCPQPRKTIWLLTLPVSLAQFRPPSSSVSLLGLSTRPSCHRGPAGHRARSVFHLRTWHKCLSSRLRVPQCRVLPRHVCVFLRGTHLGWSCKVTGRKVTHSGQRQQGSRQVGEISGCPVASPTRGIPPRVYLHFQLLRQL